MKVKMPTYPLTEVVDASWTRQPTMSGGGPGRGAEGAGATPFIPGSSTARVRSPACAMPACSTLHLPHPPDHHAVKMYMPMAAHPHCTCTRKEVLAKGLQHMKGLFDRKHQHKTHTGAVHIAAAQFLAGAFGGASATYTTHWLDTVKVRMQTFPEVYPNSRHCIQATLHEGGLRALYKGAVPAVTGHAIKASAVFMSYGVCQEAVWRWSTWAGFSVPPVAANGHHELRVWQLASAGAMTGVLASFVLCPIELIKCRMQALSTGGACKAFPPNKSGRVGSATVARCVMQEDGFRGLYRGLCGMWAKEIPGSFIYFGSYEFAKSIAHAQAEGGHFSKPTVFLCGMFAGLCFCITHPIESIKTRVQVTTQSGQQGFIKATQHILKTEGIKPLCSGLKPNMVRACLYSGVQFVTYEFAKDHLLGDTPHNT